MNKIDIYKDSNKFLYLDWDYDTDGSIYWRERGDIPHVDSNSFDNLFFLYEKYISNLIQDSEIGWLYTIGFVLYFVFDGKRYCYLLPCNTIGCNEFYVRKLIYRLRLMKCSRFYYKVGRLD